MSQRTRLILASASPRRRALIPIFGLPVLIQPAHIDEEQIEAEHLARGGAPADLAAILAAAKARAIAAEIQSTAEDPVPIIIGSDTTVVLDGDLLGKPRDVADARRMLTLLRARTHTVVTAVAALRGAPDARPLTRTIATPVTMRAFSDAEMEAYIATGDPFDKAGSYAIQHPSFQPVARIDGCATGVIGLPLCAVAALLDDLGVTYATPTPLAGQRCPWDARCTGTPSRINAPHAQE